MNRWVIIAVLIAVIVAGGLYLAWSRPQDEGAAPGAAAPGGSAPPEASWSTQTDPDSGVTFKYPETLSTTYMRAVDWPPKVAVTPAPLACTEGGLENGLPGQTLRRVIGGNIYCVTKVNQGAAGSIYSNYTYATEKDGKVLTFTFSVQYPQCVNYADDGQRTACQSEEGSFDLDGLIDRIIRTAKAS